MLDKKEIASILAVSLILAVTLSLIKSATFFIYAFLASFIILIANIFAKKIVSFYVDAEIKVKIWEIKRWGLAPHKYLKKPFPAGAFFPIILTALTVGYATWMACLSFDVRPKTYRASRRFGLYSFSEMTEWHIALIAAAGILANLLFAIIGYLLGFSDFARWSIYFSAFNMIPFSDLDGSKIFFGSTVLWTFLAVMTLIALGYAFLLI
jgi:Zn-dependent protease